MLTGAHVIVFSSNATADQQFLTDVLELGSVDAGDGFLIFGLPPAEVALHQTDAAKGAAPGKHELYLITDDVAAFVAKLAAASIAHDPPANRGWGTVTSVTLPSGIKLGVYEAHHARPAAKKHAGAALKKAAKVVRKVAKATKKAAKATKKAAKATTKAAKATTKATQNTKKAGA